MGWSARLSPRSTASSRPASRRAGSRRPSTALPSTILGARSTFVHSMPCCGQEAEVLQGIELVAAHRLRARARVGTQAMCQLAHITRCAVEAPRRRGSRRLAHARGFQRSCSNTTPSPMGGSPTSAPRPSYRKAIFGTSAPSRRPSIRALFFWRRGRISVNRRRFRYQGTRGNRWCIR